jgi:hypothetical protein
LGGGSERHYRLEGGVTETSTDPRRLVNCLEADPSENTAGNSTCFVAIVGYHGNSVYRTIAWIPICVIVTSVAIWKPVGVSHGRLPHLIWKSTRLTPKTPEIFFKFS